MATIYHNPKCSTSRKTLDLLRERGIEPTVIEYLRDPPDKAKLVELLQKMGKSPRELLRKKGPVYEELGLADPKWTDDEILDFMIEHPVLIERPIVVTEKGVRLARPIETVHEIL